MMGIAGYSEWVDFGRLILIQGSLASPLQDWSEHNGLGANGSQDYNSSYKGQSNVHLKNTLAGAAYSANTCPLGTTICADIILGS